MDMYGLNIYNNKYNFEILNSLQSCQWKYSNNGNVENKTSQIMSTVYPGNFANGINANAG